MLRPFIAVAVVVSLASCVESAPPVPLSEQARNICLRNGFSTGSRAFNDCFNSTFQQLSYTDAARRQAAARSTAVGLQMAFPPPAPVYFNPPCIQQGGFCR